MSNTFGVPPPPRPLVFEPARTASLADRPEAEHDGPYLVPETDPWRRRAAVAMAFVAVALLVFANLATWLHFTALAPARASNLAAAAAYDEVALGVNAIVQPLVLVEIERQASANAGTNPTRAATATDVNPAVTSAVAAAIDAPAFRSTWEAAVRASIDRQKALANGATPNEIESSGVVLSVNLTTLLPPIKTALVDDGLTYADTRRIAVPNYTLITTDSAADHTTVLGLGDNLWWLFLLGAIGFGAGGIWLASRRIRFASFLTLDAVVMLAGCLLLVPIVNQVVAEQAVDQNQSVLLDEAYRALTRPLVTQTVTLMVIGVCVLISLRAVARVRSQAERAKTAA